MRILKIQKKEQEKFSLDLKVEQFKKPFLSARYTADYIGERIVKNFSHRNLAHNVMERVMESGAKGVKVMYSGRIRGANIARTEKFQQGTVPLSSIREDVDFAHKPALTRTGYVGVKVWISR
jgi:small subunit ribosomal protein S3